jgi:arginine decarboxylase
MKCLGLSKKIALVSGFGESDNSKINAFDNALIDAGINDCNLIKVSSILAKETELIGEFEIEKGSFVPTVISTAYGKQGETICSCLQIALNDKKYGYVFEGQGKNPREIEQQLTACTNEMAEKRKQKIISRKTITKQATITKKYGCCITAAIYIF